MDLGRDGLEAPVHNLVDLLRVPPLGQARQAGDIGKQDGHLTALALKRRSRPEYLIGEGLGVYDATRGRRTAHRSACPRGFRTGASHLSSASLR
jgi:hypothetical protein